MTATVPFSKKQGNMRFSREESKNISLSGRGIFMSQEHCFNRKIIPRAFMRPFALGCISAHLFSRDSKKFHASVGRTKHPLMLTPYTMEEYAQMRTYTVPFLCVGFALKQNDINDIDIVSVHNNEPHIHNIGIALVYAAIHFGGNCLNHFGSDKLEHIYGATPLLETARIAFDPMYDPQGEFERRYGRLDVVYRRLRT